MGRNSLSALCGHSVCVCVCVCEQRQKKCVCVWVCVLTSAVKTPHFTASAPLSIAPRTLHAPSLPLHFASIGPPPHCLTRTPRFSSCLTATCFDVSDWFHRGSGHNSDRLPVSPFFSLSRGKSEIAKNISGYMTSES